MFNMKTYLMHAIFSMSLLLTVESFASQESISMHDEEEIGDSNTQSKFSQTANMFQSLDSLNVFKSVGPKTQPYLKILSGYNDPMSS